MGLSLCSALEQAGQRILTEGSLAAASSQPLQGLYCILYTMAVLTEVAGDPCAPAFAALTLLQQAFLALRTMEVAAMLTQPTGSHIPGASIVSKAQYMAAPYSSRKDAGL